MLVRVVASVIEQDGKFLLCQRPVHKRHGGLWEFPGGKVENGESSFDAVSRELKEELGVSVVEVAYTDFSVQDPGSHYLIDFLRVRVEGEPRALEHTQLAWVTGEEMLQMPLAPSDLRYAHFRTSDSAR